VKRFFEKKVSFEGEFFQDRFEKEIKSMLEIIPVFQRVREQSAELTWRWNPGEIEAHLANVVALRQGIQAPGGHERFRTKSVRLARVLFGASQGVPETPIRIFEHVAFTISGSNDHEKVTATGRFECPTRNTEDKCGNCHSVQRTVTSSANGKTAGNCRTEECTREARSTHDDR
jgi:hypothetical protein